MTSNNQYTANAMRRAFRILAAVIALIGGGLSGPPAHSCMTLTGAGGACGGGGAGSTTTWDPANKTAGITLSGGNLVATTSGTSNGVRATNGVAGGKMFYQFVITVAATAGNDYYGVANSAWVPGTWVGANAIGVNINTSAFSGGSSIGSIDAISLGSVVQVAVDFGANLVWVKVGAGNWNANALANPATGVGGYTFTPGTGPFYPAADMETATSVNTVNFNATPPAGFSNW